jgi:diguanylate cyclase (GGDEF)-like protein
LLCLSWQRQFDRLLRSQFKTVRLEQQKAETDQLTGLLNRRSFEQRLQEKLQSLQAGQQLSLGLLDIDYFKRYNDHYGHLDGDLVLVQLSRLLSADPTLLVVRFGGEEFILVEQHNADISTSLLQLPDKLAAMAIPHKNSPFGVVTASIGIITLNYPASGYQSGQLMHQADQLLYQAKQQGRNQARQQFLN